jgi:hypothetical protein
MTCELIRDISNEDYHSRPSVSRSQVLELQKSPKKYWYKYISGLAEKETSEALDLGTAFHTLILEPSDFGDTVAIVPDDKKNPTKAQINAKNPSDSTRLLIEWWDNFRAQNEGKILLRQKDITNLQDMAKSIREEKAAQKILGKKGIIEGSFFWTDEETGIMVQSRPDFITADGKICVDVKTTKDASADAFQKAIVNYGYDLQAFMCVEACRRYFKHDPDAFIFIACEKEPPYDTAFYLADEYILRRGEMLYRNLLDKLKECQDADHWPSMGGGFVEVISLPKWEINKMENENE